MTSSHDDDARIPNSFNLSNSHVCASSIASVSWSNSLPCEAARSHSFIISASVGLNHLFTSFMYESVSLSNSKGVLDAISLIRSSDFVASACDHRAFVKTASNLWNCDVVLKTAFPASTIEPIANNHTKAHLSHDNILPCHFIVSFVSLNLLCSLDNSFSPVFL